MVYAMFFPQLNIHFRFIAKIKMKLSQTKEEKNIIQNFLIMCLTDSGTYNLSVYSEIFN